ncbi:coiled-coil domain-containing protein 141 isoform X2 [Scyliorhinus canicula]|uniref:coiled-coil domain-containing protein 141 isoform X2 n=1 Tax=Scyliorhinus canicula TaxID=7830 RepID=UPI0018F6EDD3|nr:coiled-coil domain-containing protein 141 isoform X2 [Scyliorhinus canicula]
MSNESDSGGRPSATTISTVAVQTGDSRIVVAILKSAMCVELQLVESVPNLLEIGSNVDETRKILNEHEILLAKLKAREGGVRDLLLEADRTAEANKNQSQLYEEMGKTLGDNWTTLNQLLENRKTVLKTASEFFDQALEFAIKIDEAEDFLNSAQIFEDMGSLKQLLHHHQHLKKVLLTNSMALLNKSQEILTLIKEFKVSGPKINSELIHGAQSSCVKVESLMELLQDRRRQLEDQSHRQRLDLEQILRIYQWDQQVDEVMQWFQHDGETYLQNEKLGSSLTENEWLLQEHQEFGHKAKEITSAAERLQGEADEILLMENFTNKEQMVFQNQKLKLMCEEFWLLMKERASLLQEAHEFFNSANKGFDVLGDVESHLKHLNLKSLCLSELSAEHNSLCQAIEVATSEALQKGQQLLIKIDPQRATGIQEMIGYIQQRVDYLTRQCYAHKELALKKQELISSFDDHFEKVSGCLQACRSRLSSTSEPGSSLSESEGILNKYLEMSDHSKEVENELERITGIIKQAEMFDVPEVKSFSERFVLLNAEWKTLWRDLNAQVEHLQSYTTFLKQAEEVEATMQNLEDCYQSQSMKDNEENVRSMLELADSKLQLVLMNFLSLQDLGFNFKSAVNMRNESSNQNLKKSVNVVESKIDQLNKRKLALTDQWTSYQLQLNQIQSVKKQWKKFKEQLKKMLEDELIPPFSIDLGCNFEAILELQDKFNKAKPHLQQLNAEVEYRVKIAELLTLKGVFLKERNEKITELQNLHQQVKNKTKEYEMIFLMIVKFHKTTQELEEMMKTGELQYPELLRMSDTSSQAKIQLSHHKEKEIHVRHLYKLSLTLATDIISIAQQSKFIEASVDSLQQKLEVLEGQSIQWSAKSDQHGEKLEANLHYCTMKEETNELKESYKELKKKFNNLKFSYLKKNEKSRNLKAVRNQAQQVEIYTERFEIFKKKMIQYVTKGTTMLEKHVPRAEINVLEESLNELQKQLNELDKTVEEYKQSLDMTIQLQQAMEESQFWCEDANGTVVRVGKYSAECETKEAVGVLYKQFEKFVWQTVPQQEERIQQITELAMRLYGSEEANKLVNKLATKHNEILESIKELCNGLRELESKLHNVAEAAGKPTKNSSLSDETRNVQEQKQMDTSDFQSFDGEGLQTAYQTLDNHEQEKMARASSKPTVDATNGTKENKNLNPSLIQVADPNHVLGLTTEDVQTITDDVKNCREGKTKVQCYTTTLSQPFKIKQSQTKSLFASTYSTNSERRIFVLHLIGNRSENIELFTTTLGNNSEISVSNSSKEDQMDETENRGTPDSRTELQKESLSSSHEPLNANLDGLLSTQTTDSVPEDSYSQEAAELFHPSTEGSTVTDGDVQNESFVDETLSVEEYECMSPDDISLPPLPETPESNILHSETEVDKMSRLSSQSLFAGSYSGQPQIQASYSRMTDNSDLLAPVGTADTVNHSRSQVYSGSECHSSSRPNHSTEPCTKYRSESSSFIHSPLTIPAPNIVSSMHMLKSQMVTNSSACDSFCEVHETQLQTYDMHESVTETQELLHGRNRRCFRKELRSNRNNLYTSPEPLAVPLSIDQSVHDTGYHTDTAIAEEIRRTSRSTTKCNLASNTPNFSKLLSNVNVVEGSPVTLEIDVTGFPEPTLTWYKNGQKLTTDQHFKISNKEGKHILFIDKVSDKDAGIYVVRAKNSNGTVSSNAILQVQGNCSLRCFHTDDIDWFTCLGLLCTLYISLFLMYMLLI